MKKNLLLILTPALILVGGLTYAFTSSEKSIDNCPLKGTADCPLVEDCEMKGTAECPYSEGTAQAAAGEEVSSCCEKK